MLALIDTHPDCDVLEPEYLRLLGYPPGQTLEGRPRELGDWARGWYAAHGKPWIFARELTSSSFDEEGVHLEKERFASNRLSEQLRAAQAHGVVLVAVSAGAECEAEAQRLWQEEKPDEYFFLEVFGSAAVERLVVGASGQICHWAESNGMTALPHYSPGYADWDIAEQEKLFGLFQRLAPPELSNALQVLPTGMLNPKKSLLAVFGITRHLDKTSDWRRFVPCQNCSLLKCQYRRLPYSYAPEQIEDVRRLQSSDRLLTPGGRYTVNQKALRKWAEERLTIKVRHDGSLEARFRYSGTTCTNLGRSLDYDYHITLSPPGDGYRIQSMVCVPAPGDEGHASQCGYIADAASFQRQIASEKPLLGRPLNAIFSWERAFSPSGCYCETSHRMHKWGLVYEVIHFALAERERNGVLTTTNL